MSKQCRVCNKPLVVGENISKKLFNHRDYICTPCNSAKKKEWDVNHAEHVRKMANERMRKWRSNPANKNKEDDRRPKYYDPGKAKEYQKKYCRENREKKLAHMRLSYAVKTGKIEKKPCSICGSVRVEAHHPDYSQPLHIEWLCSKHHKAVHL